MAASPKTFGRLIWLWAPIYFALLAGVVLGMFAARDWALADLSAPASLADWQQWREDVRTEQERPTTVERRIPKSTEPPMLVLMRDQYGVLLGAAVVFSSLLYWVFAWLITGMMKTPVQSRQDSAAI